MIAIVCSLYLLYNGMMQSEQAVLLSQITDAACPNTT